MLTELVRFNEAVDQALTESIAWYSKKLDDSRDLLLGVLGHDLRNPLNAVQVSASCLLNSGQLSGTRAKAVSCIVNSTERMRQIMDDLLDFTRSRLGSQLPISLRPADLAEQCLQVVDELRTAHPERMLHLTCSGNLRGAWDVRRIGQMLSNLVANALKHGDPAGAVTVTVQGHADQVTLAVHNWGAPIDEEARSTLFEPLMRGAVRESEARGGASGAGLGLYIAREIAVAHGGSIELTSSEEEGTTFTARLPRSPGSQSAVTESASR